MSHSTVVVIGASRGYGKAIIQTSLSHLEGDLKQLVFIGQNENGMKQLKEEVMQTHPKMSISIYQLDLEMENNKIYSKFSSILKEIDLQEMDKMYMIYNSGVLIPTKYIPYQNVSEIISSIQINFTSFSILNTAFFNWCDEISKSSQNSQLESNTTQSETDQLNTQQYKQTLPNKIICIQISSLLGQAPPPSLILYGATKAARNTLFSGLASELKYIPSLKTHDIKFLTWSPGPMESTMYDELTHCDHFESSEDLKNMKLTTFEKSANEFWKLVLEDTYTSGSVIDIYDVIPPL